MKEDNVLIYVVDDDVVYSSVIAHYLSLNPNYIVKKFHSSKEILASLHERPHIITLDYSLPDTDGDKLLVQIKELSPESNVIVISGQEDIKVVINLFKKGAHDYLVKDGDTLERLWMAIQNLRETLSLKREVENLKLEVEKKYDFYSSIIGNSPVIKHVFELMGKAVNTNITVSVTGETGTGKELVAKSIHFNSTRKKYPFVAVNVSAIPKDLIESELFGYEKGAFTSAIARRIGKFEEAHKGTLFLDEIGEMDINMQTKLLRVLQEKEITRIGSNEVIKTDARIIVATNRNLQIEVEKGNFRQDLYYRLLGLSIHLPPLRNRGNDIIMIAKYFVDQFCKENNLPKKALSIEAKKKLLGYLFPGNIRELKSIIDLSCVMSDNEEIQEEHIQLNGNAKLAMLVGDLNLSLRQYTAQYIQHQLDKNNYDVLKVADKLKVGKSTIYRMVNSKEIKLYKRKYEL